ncbi:DUF1036 domain-containing protein [Mangrovibrevibacter kandeliae]|uniref:DUF1036 domain-containing protein n=1 Tax=Mangrovibrevibacter kandeliae TaxID=2968473 RepID=UPI002117D915|nr:MULTISPECIES: DUF1036 domain-containing protein [unclassified Aurantimonas]MCQ8783261.1 DUF1036 domain-containing protein [Aurantimonas sp. CSK15Z-1]MCW4116224.1 DUF1036 domain-containing protein [Aurantimonas sp. MSK8Z-1]
MPSFGTLIRFGFGPAGTAALALAAFLSPLSAAPARADFRVCNGTQSLVGVAIGYRAEAGWTTEGWWRIPATTCKSIIEGELSSRFYYLYAEDAEGRGRWGGQIDLCIAENEFKIVGVKDCFARGYQKMGFREYDTGEQGSWMVQLTEAPREGVGAQ